MPDEFDGMASRIVVSRSVFEQLYDPVIEPKIPEALQFRALSLLRDRRAPITVREDKDRADFAEALRLAHKHNLIFDFFAKHANRLFADPAQETVALQSIVNLKQVFPAGAQLTMGRIAALRRTCRIICESAQGIEKGSGFLIGPHLALTNWHVIKSMLDKNTGRELDGSHNKMKFEFDALLREDGSVGKLVDFAPTRHWLVVAREAHLHEVAGGGKGQNAGPWPNDPNELADKLDFAVIELDGSPGLDRGWYDINQSPWPQPGTAIDLFQFPLGRAMTYLTQDLVAPTVFQNNAQPPRIEHLVNTEKGSSGGLCLDMASNAVALHQAGYTFKNGVNSEGKPAEMAVRNAAIPLAFIATVAGQIVKDRIAEAPLILRSTPAGLPILGRRKFQILVDRALRGDIRIVAVQTQFDQVTRQAPSKIGKSFSSLILQALLPAPDNVVFSVSSARLTQDAHKAALLIVETIHPPSATKVPSAPTGQTSLDADTIGTLVTPVVDAMRAAAGNGILWLAIDDLDRNPVLTEIDHQHISQRLVQGGGGPE